MVKILICGNVDNEGWPLLVSRLEELQFSNHGPFELLVLAQPLVASYDVISSSFERLQKLEIQICAFVEGNMEIWPSYWTIQTKAVGIFNGPKHLTIAYMFQDQSGELDSEVSSAIGGLGYRGCDLLITSKWPTGCAHYLGESDVQECPSLNISTSKNISAFASSVRPRYHIVGGLGKFYQRPPYINHRIDNTPQLFTRLISIDAVSTSKDKNKKWLHALSLNPIIYMKASELEEAPTSFTENPYNNSRYHVNDTSSEQPHKRFRHLEGSAAPNSFFFDGVSNSSSSALSNIQFNTRSNKTLFIGGLAKDSNEADLKRILPDAVHVRRITGKAYAFVEFSSPESATKVLQNSNKGHGLVLHNRKLSVGWSAAKAGGDEKPSTDGSSNFDLGTAMRDRVLIPPTEDSKILFIGNVPNISDIDIKLKSLFEEVVSVKTGKLFAFLEFESFDRAMAVVTKSINEQIKLNDVPLVVGWAKTPKLSHPTDCRVLFIGNIPIGTTAHDIEAICSGWTSIKQPAGRDYAFIEFDNPEKAIECFQNLISNQVQINGNLLKIGWAKGRAADKLEQSSDCWFCLASPSVKIHLIVTVGNYNYLAIPRGGITDRHLLVCPIDCVPSRVHLSAESRSEEAKFCDAVQKMFVAENCAMLLFERALRTKNSRDHMQLHLLPVPFNKLSSTLQVFTESSQHHNIKFHEIDDEKSVEDAVLTMAGGPYQEYFYVEIPFNENQPLAKRKFVYVQDDTNTKFPMFFGSEIGAKMIGRPERANWKNCILNENEETKVVDEIRELFSPYDFTS